METLKWQWFSFHSKKRQSIEYYKSTKRWMRLIHIHTCGGKKEFNTRVSVLYPKTLMILFWNHERFRLVQNLIESYTTPSLLCHDIFYLNYQKHLDQEEDFISLSYPNMSTTDDTRSSFLHLMILIVQIVLCFYVLTYYIAGPN